MKSYQGNYMVKFSYILFKVSFLIRIRKPILLLKEVTQNDLLLPLRYHHR